MIDNTVFTLKNDSSVCNPTENKFLTDCGSIFILLGWICISAFKSVWAESQFIYWHEVFQKSTWSLISDLFSVKRYLIFFVLKEWFPGDGVLFKNNYDTETARKRNVLWVL